jgi:hypothetical protein
MYLEQDSQQQVHTHHLSPQPQSKPQPQQMSTGVISRDEAYVNSYVTNNNENESIERRRRRASFGGVGIHDRYNNDDSVPEIPIINQQVSGDAIAIEQQSQSQSQSPSIKYFGSENKTESPQMTRGSSQLLDAAVNITESFMQQYSHDIRIPEGEGLSSTILFHNI